MFASSFLPPSLSRIVLMGEPPPHLFFPSRCLADIRCRIYPKFKTRIHLLALHRAIILYEKTTRMRNSSTPDVVPHVAMLFREVIRPDDAVFWAPASTEDGTTFWSNIVRFDAMRISDRSLFRVLEWVGRMSMGHERESGGLDFFCFIFPSGLLCVGDGSLV